MFNVGDLVIRTGHNNKDVTKGGVYRIGGITSNKELELVGIHGLYDKTLFELVTKGIPNFREFILNEDANGASQTTNKTGG